jgi:hypothetical protein
MKSVTLSLGFVVALFGAAGLAAQEKPNFSGTWIGVGPQPEIRQLTIQQDSSTLSLEGEPNVPKRTFKLDGTDTEMSAPDGKPLLAKAAWEGNTLVVTIYFPELKQDIRRLTWVIDAEGQLVMETAFVGGKPQAPVKQVFKRQPESGTEFYLRYRKTALAAKSVDEILAFWSSALLHEFKMEPEDARAGTLGMVKRMEGSLGDLRVVQETATPNGATLTLEAIGPDKKAKTGTIELVKENGAWKVVEAEQWKAKD